MPSSGSLHRRRLTRCTHSLSSQCCCRCSLNRCNHCILNRCNLYRCIPNRCGLNRCNLYRCSLNHCTGCTHSEGCHCIRWSRCHDQSHYQNTRSSLCSPSIDGTCHPTRSLNTDWQLLSGCSRRSTRPSLYDCSPGCRRSDYRGLFLLIFVQNILLQTSRPTDHPAQAGEAELWKTSDCARSPCWTCRCSHLWCRYAVGGCVATCGACLRHHHRCHGCCYSLG